jgi:flagellar biosynthesis activator protein FlaF
MSDPYRHASDAYSKWGHGPVDQRRLEGDVLLGAASRLEAARREWRPESGRALEAALLHNRKVWTIFASGAADEASALPIELRDNVISIAVFVFRRSLQVLARPEPGALSSLRGRCHRTKASRDAEHIYYGRL